MSNCPERAALVLIALTTALGRPAAACPFTLQPAPFSSPAPPDAYLDGVSIVGPGSAWAVGLSGNPGAQVPHRFRWDGAAWAEVGGPSGPNPSNGLTAVLAIDEDNAWAVGYSEDSTTLVPLIQRWDGAAWANVPCPTTSGSPDVSDVDALACDDIRAVGTEIQGNTATPYLIRCDLTSCTVQPGPAPNGVRDYYYGIDAVAPDDIWVVGSSETIFWGVPLILHWDGSSWQSVPYPILPDRTGILDVKVVGTNDVWVCGVNSSGGIETAVVWHYDGTSFTDTGFPGATLDQQQARALAATGPSDVHVLELDYTRSPPFLSTGVIATWDGQAWCRDQRPGTALYGIDVRADGNAWVVGVDPAGVLAIGRTASSASALVLLAVRDASDVVLDWSPGTWSLPGYNVHRELSKLDLAPPPSPPRAAVTGVTRYTDPGAVTAPDIYFYEVYRRHCAGGSIFD